MENLNNSIPETSGNTNNDIKTNRVTPIVPKTLHSTRIIKSMFVLDPTKLKKLGLDSKIYNAFANNEKKKLDVHRTLQVVQHKPCIKINPTVPNQSIFPSTSKTVISTQQNLNERETTLKMPTNFNLEVLKQKLELKMNLNNPNKSTTFSNQIQSPINSYKLHHNQLTPQNPKPQHQFSSPSTPTTPKINKSPKVIILRNEKISPIPFHKKRTTLVMPNLNHRLHNINNKNLHMTDKITICNKNNTIKSPNKGAHSINLIQNRYISNQNYKILPPRMRKTFEQCDLFSGFTERDVNATHNRSKRQSKSLENICIKLSKGIEIKRRKYNGRSPKASKSHDNSDIIDLSACDEIDVKEEKNADEKIFPKTEDLGQILQISSNMLYKSENDNNNLNASPTEHHLIPTGKVEYETYVIKTSVGATSAAEVNTNAIEYISNSKETQNIISNDITNQNESKTENIESLEASDNTSLYDSTNIEDEKYNDSCFETQDNDSSSESIDNSVDLVESANNYPILNQDRGVVIFSSELQTSLNDIPIIGIEHQNASATSNLKTDDVMKSQTPNEINRNFIFNTQLNALQRNEEEKSEIKNNNGVEILLNNNVTQSHDEIQSFDQNQSQAVIIFQSRTNTSFENVNITPDKKKISDADDIVVINTEVEKKEILHSPDISDNAELLTVDITEPNDIEQEIEIQSTDIDMNHEKYTKDGSHTANVEMFENIENSSYENLERAIPSKPNTDERNLYKSDIPKPIKLKLKDQINKKIKFDHNNTGHVQYNIESIEETVESVNLDIDVRLPELPMNLNNNEVIATSETQTPFVPDRELLIVDGLQHDYTHSKESNESITIQNIPEPNIEQETPSTSKTYSSKPSKLRTIKRKVKQKILKRKNSANTESKSINQRVKDLEEQNKKLVKMLGFLFQHVDSKSVKESIAGEDLLFLKDTFGNGTERGADRSHKPNQDTNNILDEEKSIEIESTNILNNDLENFNNATDLRIDNDECVILENTSNQDEKEIEVMKQLQNASTNLQASAETVPKNKLNISLEIIPLAKRERKQIAIQDGTQSSEQIVDNLRNNMESENENVSKDDTSTLLYGNFDTVIQSNRIVEAQLLENQTSSNKEESAVNIQSPNNFNDLEEHQVAIVATPFKSQSSLKSENVTPKLNLNITKKQSVLWQTNPSYNSVAEHLCATPSSTPRLVIDYDDGSIASPKYSPIKENSSMAKTLFDIPMKLIEERTKESTESLNTFKNSNNVTEADADCESPAHTFIDSSTASNNNIDSNTSDNDESVHVIEIIEETESQLSIINQPSISHEKHNTPEMKISPKTSIINQVDVDGNNKNVELSKTISKIIDNLGSINLPDHAIDEVSNSSFDDNHNDSIDYETKFDDNIAFVDSDENPSLDLEPVPIIDVSCEKIKKTMIELTDRETSDIVILSAPSVPIIATDKVPDQREDKLNTDQIDAAVEDEQPLQLFTETMNYTQTTNESLCDSSLNDHDKLNQSQTKSVDCATQSKVKSYKRSKSKNIFENKEIVLLPDCSNDLPAINIDTLSDEKRETISLNKNKAALEFEQPFITVDQVHVSQTEATLLSENLFDSKIQNQIKSKSRKRSKLKKEDSGKQIIPYSSTNVINQSPVKDKVEVIFESIIVQSPSESDLPTDEPQSLKMTIRSRPLRKSAKESFVNTQLAKKCRKSQEDCKNTSKKNSVEVLKELNNKMLDGNSENEKIVEKELHEEFPPLIDKIPLDMDTSYKISNELESEENGTVPFLDYIYTSKTSELAPVVENVSGPTLHKIKRKRSCNQNEILVNNKAKQLKIDEFLAVHDSEKADFVPSNQNKESDQLEVITKFNAQPIKSFKNTNNVKIETTQESLDLNLTNPIEVLTNEIDFDQNRLAVIKNTTEEIVKPKKSRGRPKGVSKKFYFSEEVPTPLAPSTPSDLCRTRGVYKPIIDDLIIDSIVSVEKNSKSRRSIKKSLKVIEQDEIDDSDVKIVKQNQDMEINSETVNVIESSAIVKRPYKKRDGRRKKNIKKQDPPQENLQDDEQNCEMVVCGNCKISVRAKDWLSHLTIHNGLSWRENIDESFNLEDERVAVLKILHFQKQNNIQIMKCEKCDTYRKSALGLMSHMQLCGVAEENRKVACEKCGTKILPCSMRIHQLSHCSYYKEQEKKLIEESIVYIAQSGEGAPEVSEAGRLKRKSVKKAEILMKTIVEQHHDTHNRIEDLYNEIRPKKITGGVARHWRVQLRKNNIAQCVNEKCEFTATTEAELMSHSYNCELYGDIGIFCRNCSFRCEDKSEMEQHIKSLHAEILEKYMEMDETIESDATMSDESSDSDISFGFDEDELYEDEDFDEEFEDEDEEVENYYDYDEDDDNEEGQGLENGEIRKRRRVANEPYKPTSEAVSLLSFYASIIKESHKKPFYEHTKTWTLDFISKNYSIEPLFTNFLPNSIIYLPNEKALDYIPPFKESMKFSIKNKLKYQVSIGKEKYSELFNLHIFEGDIINNTSPIFYCGGTVNSMEWITFPESYDGEQYLVVSTKSDEFNINIGQEIEAKCLIQIWSMGRLTNQRKIAFQPIHKYSFVFDHGPIYDMKICPSGGYIPEIRLAILAVTSMIGDVFIYALPCNINMELSSSIKIIKLPPSQILISRLPSTNKLGNQIRKLAWTRDKNHSIITAGFTSGLVCIWNLNIESSLLRRTINNCLCLLPSKSFQAFCSAINGLEIFHVDNSKFLMVGADRYCKIYDINSYTDPIEVSTTAQKSIISCAKWPLHWSGIFIGKDLGLCLQQNAITLTQPREIAYKNLPMQPVESFVTDISFNDYLNSYVSSTDSGDLLTHHSRELVYNVDFKECRHFKLIMGYTDQIKLNNEQLKTNNVTITTEIPPPLNVNKSTVLTREIIENNALVFCDIEEPIQATLRSLNIKHFRQFPVDEYPVTRISKTICNPNINSYNYIAVGYQAGFVRLRRMHARKQNNR